MTAREPPRPSVQEITCSVKGSPAMPRDRLPCQEITCHAKGSPATPGDHLQRQRITCHASIPAVPPFDSLRRPSWHSPYRTTRAQQPNCPSSPTTGHIDPCQPSCYTKPAGWSSPVARWAHNPKVAGSNPAPATKSFNHLQDLIALGKSPLSPNKNGCDLL